jgi:MFS transporter, putative metabolite:H+ symporter
VVSARLEGKAQIQAESTGSRPYVTPAADTPGMRLALLFFLSAWATVAFPVMSGALILAKGLSLSDALGQVAAAAFGPVIGQLLCGWFAGSTDRRHLISGCAIGMGLSAWAFLMADTAVTLMLANTLFMVFGAVLVPNLHLYGAEILPTARRASVLGVAWSANRVASAVAPFLLVPVLQHAGVAAVTLIVSISLLLMMSLLANAPEAPVKRCVR